MLWMAILKQTVRNVQHNNIDVDSSLDTLLSGAIQRTREEPFNLPIAKVVADE